MTIFIVDCEAFGGCPRTGQLTEFGAVELITKQSFHGVILKSQPSKENPAIPEAVEGFDPLKERKVFEKFYQWLGKFPSPYVFVSDNPAFDWQWINDGFHRILGVNPFGHSARRIGDYYAGRVGNWKAASKWKRMRVTKHTHHPVDDAMGNAEALEAILAGKT